MYIMDKFVEKFNIFDLFTMLIPGIAISSLFGVSLSFKYYSVWQSYGNGKYVLFFVLAYIFGLLFSEIGTIFDNLFMYNFLYKGKPRKIFLLNNKYMNIFDDDLAYKDALRIREYLENYISINDTESY